MRYVRVNTFTESNKTDLFSKKAPIKRSSFEFSNRDDFMLVITTSIKTKCFYGNC